MRAGQSTKVKTPLSPLVLYATKSFFAKWWPGSRDESFFAKWWPGSRDEAERLLEDEFALMRRHKSEEWREVVRTRAGLWKHGLTTHPSLLGKTLRVVITRTGCVNVAKGDRTYDITDANAEDYSSIGNLLIRRPVVLNQLLDLWVGPVDKSYEPVKMLDKSYEPVEMLVTVCKNSFISVLKRRNLEAFGPLILNLLDSSEGCDVLGDWLISKRKKIPPPRNDVMTCLDYLYETDTKFRKHVDSTLTSIPVDSSRKCDWSSYTASFCSALCQTAWSNLIEIPALKSWFSSKGAKLIPDGNTHDYQALEKPEELHKTEDRMTLYEEVMCNKSMSTVINRLSELIRKGYPTSDLNQPLADLARMTGADVEKEFGLLKKQLLNPKFEFATTQEMKDFALKLCSREGREELNNSLKPNLIDLE